MNAPAHTVEPELTIYHVASLRPQWLAAWSAGTRSFDLAQVAEIDGAGAQLLVSLWRMARRDGEPLTLDNPGANVREALALIGATAVLENVPEGAAHA
jgi:ABC-type transporter Mla MlaB component